MKTVYTCFCTDIIHEGHRNLIHEARKYGEVVVGVLNDASMIRYCRFPAVSFEERLANAKSIEGVSRVVVQRNCYTAISSARFVRITLSTGTTGVPVPRPFCGRM